MYLDTDQKGGRDPYGGLVAVVYIKVDSMRCENINKALLFEGVVVETNYADNEFNPSDWTLYSSVPNLQDVTKYLLISSGAGLIINLILHFSSR